jgi:nucleoid-associated protein YgaU
MVDYLLKSKPRISFSVFSRVLHSASSPAAGEAQACWNAIVKHGIDPAVALAQFDKESTYGKFGIARTHKSWGNLRGAGPSGFKSYRTWALGADDYARLLSGSLYAGSSHYNTVRTMPYRYAPSADHNNPAAYGQFMVNMIQHYRGLRPNVVKQFYTVQPGDTLSGIAKRYRTTVAHLLAFPENAKYRDNPNLIHAGDKVRVR